MIPVMVARDSVTAEQGILVSSSSSSFSSSSFFFSVFRLFSYWNRIPLRSVLRSPHTAPLRATILRNRYSSSSSRLSSIRGKVNHETGHQKPGLKTNWFGRQESEMPFDSMDEFDRMRGDAWTIRILEEEARKKKRTGYSAIDDDNVLQGARYSAIHITTILSYNNDTNGSTQLGEKLRSPSQGERIRLSGGDGRSLKQVYYLCFTFSGAQHDAFFHTSLRFFSTQGIDVSLPRRNNNTADGFSGKWSFPIVKQVLTSRRIFVVGYIVVYQTERGSLSELSLEISMPAFSFQRHRMLENILLDIRRNWAIDYRCRHWDYYDAWKFTFATKNCCIECNFERATRLMNARIHESRENFRKWEQFLSCGCLFAFIKHSFFVLLRDSLTTMIKRQGKSVEFLSFCKTNREFLVPCHSNWSLRCRGIHLFDWF